VIEKMQEIGIAPLYVEGRTHADWIIVDYGEVMVHILLSDVRERYRLEELWRAASIIDVNIDISRCS
jgi:ribosome silencing factor RsfS/YbeB/iojap